MGKRRIIKKYLFFVPLTVFIIQSSVCSLDTISVSGKVTDRSGAPVNKATVKAIAQKKHGKSKTYTQSTNSKGFYAFKKIVTVNAITLKVSKKGYKSKSRSFNVRNGMDTTVNFTLLPPKLVKQMELKEESRRDLVRSKPKMMVKRSMAVMGAPSRRPAPLPGVRPPAEGEGTVQPFHTEEYDRIYENPFLEVTQNPLSTFSIDVDVASYSNVRRFINENRLPPKDAVRIEEMINYFTYDYPQPKDKHPFSITTEVADCPWNEGHDLVNIGLMGKKINTSKMPPSNLVFLLDVSGSMNNPNKLPLVKSAFKLLVNQLTQNDRISIVVYAGREGLLLPSTNGSEKARIQAAINNLRAGGSTAGGAGIKLAYKIARENFIKKGNNRVILATDGDFNVGVSSDAELVRLIEEKRKLGIFLTVLGFGTGNYKDSKMEQLADKGNGNYAYIDNILEAKKVLVKEMGATLLTIAKDVKIQVEFNPAKIKAYRLIGYENRMLRKEDFHDDKKDAGEMGAGHTVTAIYETVPAGSKEEFGKVDKLKYQKTVAGKSGSKELFTVKFRYKPPRADKSILIEKPVKDRIVPFDKSSDNFKFSTTVAGFGMLLRDSRHKGNITYEKVLEMAKSARGQDKEGYRYEFIKLVESCKLLSNKK
jgi:Ca-activated chloride channel family protein